MEDIEDLGFVQLVDGLDPEELISILEEMWDEQPYPEMELEDCDLEMVSPESLPSPPPAESAAMPASALPSPSPSLPSPSPAIPVMLTPPLTPAALPTMLPSPSPALPATSAAMPGMLTPALVLPAHPTVPPSPSPAQLPFQHQPYTTFSSNHYSVPCNGPWIPCFNFAPMPYYPPAQWPPQLYIPNVAPAYRQPQFLGNQGFTPTGVLYC